MCIISGTENFTFSNVVNITVDSDSITPQKKKNGIDKDCEVPYGKN